MGKTFTAVNFIYRLVKYAGAKRVLFLVDRGNLGEQTLKEFQQFVSPVNNYKFTEEYIVQQLTHNTLDSSARVVIGTIQRLDSMLNGEQETTPELDDLPIESLESLARSISQSGSGVPPLNPNNKQSRDGSATLFQQPVPVEYNPAFPIEEFDFIITDECHRSIYNLWRQVLEYFDASLIGLEHRLDAEVAAAKPGKVKGRSQAGRFADLVALVRFALEQQPVLEPFADSVTTRFNEWLMDKAKVGVKFSADQLTWLNLIRDHIATSLSIEPDDFDYAPFSQRGGLGRAHQLFGDRLLPLLDELNGQLVA